MDVDGYRHSYEGFYKKIHKPNVYKYRENDHNSRCPCTPCENSLISSLSLLLKSFEEESQLFGDRVDIARGQTLE